MKYRNKFRVSRITSFVRKRIVSYMKGDLSTYILNDIKDRLDNGEKEIKIQMTLSLYDDSIVKYLNEYHKKKSYYGWDLDFLRKAYYIICDRVYENFKSYSDIEVEFLDFSETDKRILITVKD